MKLCSRCSTVSSFLLLLLAVARSATAFSPTPQTSSRCRTWLVPREAAAMYRHRVPHAAFGPSPRHMAQDEQEQQEQDEIVPSLENSVIPPPSLPQPLSNRLDPLVQSLTRMDVDTTNAETMQVPIWGELVLDRSLYVLVPAAAFAVLGLGWSIFIALTATDDWVIPSRSEQPPTAVEVSVGGSANSNNCRGLCSNADQNLEGLRNFMNSLGK